MESHSNLTQPEWWKISKSGRMAEEIGGDGKDCKTCKCNVIVGDVGLCTIPEVERMLEVEK